MLRCLIVTAIVDAIVAIIVVGWLLARHHGVRDEDAGWPL
jgi:hypothetical protein